MMRKIVDSMLPNARCIMIPTEETEITCNSCDSDYDAIKWFETINDGIEAKDKSRLMLMNDREPLELWDWGLNEKVTIPTKESGCMEIRNFIRFIETRKF